MIFIEINENLPVEIPSELLEKAAKAALAHQAAPAEADRTIVLADDA